MSGAELVVVANRLPVNGAGPDGPWVRSPGGLVRAVLPTVQRARGAWVGWAGFAGDAPAPFRHDGVQLVPVGLSEQQHDGFYGGFANATLWPLYHDAIRRSVYDPDWWAAYVEVNEVFAEATARSAAAGGTVWIHDFQLQLVPALLRKLRPDLRIGFFLHVPFPARELFGRLPWREEVLQGLLGADVLGFQRVAGAENFATSARLWAGAEGDLPLLSWRGRRVVAEAHPISIDVAEIEALARRADVQVRAHVLRRRLGRPRTVLLGVDRLDYTKGIDARLRAFGALLESGDLERGSCVLVQVAVPTRGGEGEYAEVRKEVECLVGELNGRHGAIGEPVVSYVHQGLPLDELVSCYLAADVLLVTPFADGMNLVAKEFVAARVDGGGCLVLSEFAGAADELCQAVPANPWDEAGMSAAFLRAIRMSDGERRARMAHARAVVAAHDVARWSDGFLDRLAGADLARVA